MKATKLVAVGGAILLGAVGLVLAQDKGPSQKPAVKPATSQKLQPSAARTNTMAKAKFPVIGYLEGGGKVIIIKSGPKGPVYSVEGPDGKLLFENLTSEQLSAQAPEIHQFIKSAYAGNTRSMGGTTDASLRMLDHR